MNSQINFPFLLQAFFTDRLMHQRQASEHTIASYRDTFCLLFQFAKERLNKEPSNLTIEDLGSPFIGAFLNHLEKNRGNSARTRNVRLAAIHSFFKYIALHDPSHSSLIQGVLAMPTKRYSRKLIDFLTRDEVNALLKAPDKNTWTGRRDQLLILLAVQTGLRVSELIGLTCQDIVLGSGAHVRCRGKGRKERCTPLRKEVIAALTSWFVEQKGKASDPLFSNARGGHLSRRGVEYLLCKHVDVASKRCTSLKNKNISPHVLRHTTAMSLLQHGVDRSVIALWLGHETPETTQMYLQANLKIKEQALEKTRPFNVKLGRYRPDDQILAFLKDL